MHVDGTLSLVAWERQILGWQWNTPWEFEIEDGKVLPLVGGAHAWWTHQIREGQRYREFKKSVKRRPHLEGAQHGLAVDIITSLFRC